MLRGSLLTTYPKMKNETVNVDNVVESLSNSAFIKVVAGAKIDDANGLLHLSIAIVHVVYLCPHLTRHSQLTSDMTIHLRPMGHSLH